MDGIYDAFSQASARFSEMSEILVWAALAPVLVVLLFVGRLVLRSLINRRVHGIEAFSEGLISVDEMRRKGMISEEEYKTMRKKVAERQLALLNETKTSQNTMQLLTAVEKDPTLVAKLIPEVAQKFAAGGTVASDNSARPAPPDHSGAAGQADSSAVSPQVLAQAVDRTPPPRAAQVASLQPKKPAGDFVPGDPLSDPQFVQQAVPPRGGHRRKKPALDLDSMLAKGLISKEEYERLLSLQDKL